MFKSLILLALLPVLAAAPPGNCASINIPVQWTIVSSYPPDGSPAAITGDGAPYVNGQKVEAVINVCSGSNDATLLISGAGRSIYFDFTKPLTSGAPQLGIVRGTFLNVRNILFVPEGSDRSQEYSFTTRLGSTSSAGNFAMLNPSPDAPTVGDGSRIDTANSPYPNSRVIVRHCPGKVYTASCPDNETETWHVYPDPTPTDSGLAPTGDPITQVGALLLSSKNKWINAGEFSMRFYFVISALK